MRILVVGGAGYIGSVLTRRLLTAGHHVTVLDRLLFGDNSVEALAQQDRFRLVVADMRDADAMQRALEGSEAVVLLGAIVGEPACNRDPDLTRSVNLGGTLQTLELARAAGVKHFVFASTCSNYGVSDSDELTRETSPLRPLSVYAETKVAAEERILAARSDVFHPVVLRFSTAFGVSPRMRFDLLVSDFTLAAFRDHKIVIFGEQFWRPFVHVQDISHSIETVLAAAPERVAGEVFNIGSNAANLRKLDLGHAVQQEVPGTELEFVKRGTDPRSYRVDFSKAREQLGFATEWTVADGIREIHSGLKVGLWPDPGSNLYRN